MKFINALSNLAPLPISVIKRLFDIFVDFIESKRLRLSPISQCDLIFSFIKGSPQVFICTLSLSSFPIGASLLGKFGKL